MLRRLSSGGTAAAALAACAVALAACGEDEVISAQGDPVAGEVLVNEQADPACGECHTLEAAGFEGRSAPNLDSMQPGYQRIYEAISTGPGAMPSFADQFSDDELHNIAAYVSEAIQR